MDIQNASKKDNNKIYFLLIVVLALFATNGILFFRNKKAQEQVLKLSDEKTLMQTEIDKIEAALDKSNNDYALLSEDMQQQQEQARVKIAELREALRKGELTKQELGSAQKEVEELKQLVNQYFAQIEELKKQNADLTNQRDSLKTTVGSVTERAQSLEKQNQELDKKVRAAAALKAIALKAIALKVKSSGKESSVSKSSTAKKLSIVFKLVENEFAEKGMHNVYIRVVDPENNTINGTNGNITLANGEEVNTSYNTAIEYANDSRLYTISWTNPNPFKKGIYSVLLYADGFLMGSTKVELK
jgi:predicted RNase H-like nuclease (RuvC/YqgF family)